MLWFLLASLLPFCLHAVPTQWEWAHPTPHGNQHNSVIWGDDEFIAIGEGGNIISSQSGSIESWVVEPSDTTENLNDIAWSGSRYVSVGDQGTIVSRTSSGNWDIRTSTITHKLTDVIWNGEQFLAIGEYTISYTDPINGTQSRPAASILTSIAGSSWRLETPTLNPDRHSNVPPPRLRGITWDGSLYIASSDDGAILTSLDGIAWHTRSINSIANNGKSGSNKRFLAVGDNGLTLSSNDGISWTKRAPGISDNLHAVTWAEVHFVVVGANGTIISTRDDDGITWETEVSGSTATLRSITFNNTSSVIAVGDDGTILTRTLSPLIWDQQAVNVTSEDLHSVAWSSAIFSYIAVGSGGTILTSIDTTDWQAATNPPAGLSTDLLHVSWHDMSAAIGDEFFLATGKNGTLITTTSDFNTWVPRTSNITDEWLFDSAWDGTNHIVVGSNGTLITSTSLDGNIWTTQNAQTSEHLLSIAIDNTTTLIGGEFSLQISTNDPTSIIPADILIGTGRIASQHLNDILFDNDKYIAIGNAGTIITSDDAYDWTTPAFIIDGGSSITNDLLSIEIENETDEFLITGTWGTFLRSDDPTGDTWTSEAIPVVSPPSPSASFFYGVASTPINPDDSIVTIVGSGGDIYTSINSGLDWNLTAGPLQTKETINNLTNSDTLHVAVGDNGTILNSNNRGVDWAQATAASCGPNHLHAVTWSDVTTRFVAVGEVGTICYSDDGFTWETPPISANLPDTASTLYGIAWGKDQFVAVGGSAVNSVIYTSPFGDEWTPRNSSEPHTLRDIVWDEDHFVAIGDGGTITTSPKGISWTRNSSGTIINLNSIAVGETTTIITGTSSSPISTTILRKNSDGAWIGGDGDVILANIQINDISAGGTQFTAVAPSGTILVSSDGRQWTEVLTGTNSLFKTVLWDDSKFIAAGAAAHILYSTNPDLIITGDYTAEEVRNGETARIILSITNKGISTALATSYSGQFSRNSTFLSSTTTHGSCTMGSELICKFGNLATDETVTLTIDIVTTATGSQGHIGTIVFNGVDSDEANNTRTITLQVSRGNDDGGGAAVSYWWLAGMLIALLASGRNPNDRWRDST
ncbi:hypothetical protein MNBD_GAMMA17-2103 [hydrothermal vent metagenome]|uniref:DUF11 domain-containing protein n=1 Tax=hydrothermal vent metagenome TaxID=652676 RepID=A0A3B1A6V9_9ZZZZ